MLHQDCQITKTGKQVINMSPQNTSAGNIPIRTKQKHKSQGIILMGSLKENDSPQSSLRNEDYKD